MKKIAILLALMLSVAVGASAAQQTGTISGTAKGPDSSILAGVKVQLRNTDTGALVGTTQSGSDGGFSFTGVPAGSYSVEIVDRDGKIVGVVPMTLAAGQTVTGLLVSASALAAGGGSFFTSTAGILTGIALIGGIAAGVVIATNASASR